MHGRQPLGVNPATGLPMTPGGVDTMGNLYGLGSPGRHIIATPAPPFRSPPRPPTGPISGPLSAILRLTLLVVFLIYFAPHFWRPTPQPLLDARQSLTVHINGAAAALLPPNGAKTVANILELASR